MGSQADSLFGYGDQMGLAVFDGQVYPIWAGNFNQSHLITGTVVADPLNIWYTPMVIAAGPRIISSSMGPITLAEAASGSVSISVTFDRPIIQTRSSPAMFRSSTTTPPTARSSIGLYVMGVTLVPVPGPRRRATPSTRSHSTRHATPAASGITNFTGTYSYLIAPDDGTTTVPGTYSHQFADRELCRLHRYADEAEWTPSQTSARRRGCVVGASVTGPGIPSGTTIASIDSTTIDHAVGERDGQRCDKPDVSPAYDPMDQNADGTPDQNAVTTAFTGLTPGDVYAAPMPQPVTR